MIKAILKKEHLKEEQGCLYYNIVLPGARFEAENSFESLMEKLKTDIILQGQKLHYLI